MFEPRYHGEVRDPDTTPSQDLATEFNLHLAGSIEYSNILVIGGGLYFPPPCPTGWHVLINTEEIEG
jgi:hypothetical protein